MDCFDLISDLKTFLSCLGTHFQVPPHDQFQTIDLYENKNPNQVVDTIFALSRHAAKLGLTDIVLGPKLAEKRSLSFTEEQLRQGEGIIGLQMGFAGGANASGVVYGGRREIGGNYEKQ